MSNTNIQILVRRKQLNLKQKDLAQVLGISQGALCMIEAGRRLPRVSLANRIAKALDTTTADLWPELSTTKF
jgi:DNA-binding XRE family transcriptional regulator